MFLPKVPTVAHARLQKNAVSHPAELTTRTPESAERAFVAARKHISHRDSARALLRRISLFFRHTQTFTLSLGLPDDSPQLFLRDLFIHNTEGHHCRLRVTR
jgi:hypothetical protein